MKVYNTLPNCPQPVGPYSVAIESSGLIFLSGQIALDLTSGKLVDGGIEDQTKQVLRNIEGVLNGVGAKKADIVMTTIFLSDIRFGKVVNEIYGHFVSPDAPPARQTVAVKDLPLGALIEISVIVEKR